MDKEYLDAVSSSVAGAISRGYSIEIAYVPDDDIFMGLVFTPLWNIVTGPWNTDGNVKNSCPGMTYTWGTTLVSVVEGVAYPHYFWREDDLPEVTSEYVAVEWDLSDVSAEHLRDLFVAITENMELP